MIKLPGKAKHTCDPWRLGEFYHEMECKAWDAAIDEVQRLNATAQPVSDGFKVPEGMALLPLALTAENGAKNALIGEFKEETVISCPECFGDEECETCDGSGRIYIEVLVSWTTIKAIWAKGVEHFLAAAPGGKDD